MHVTKWKQHNRIFKSSCVKRVIKAPMKEQIHPMALFLLSLMFGLLGALHAQAQLDESWSLTVNGQTVQADADGSFFISNISAPDLFGADGPGSQPDFVSDDFLRVTGISIKTGVPRYVVSELFQIEQNKTFEVGELTFTDTPPIVPASLQATANSPTLTTLDQMTQVNVTAILGDGATADATSRSDGTVYRTSNPRMATVNSNGLVTAKAEGTVYITAGNSGATVVTRIDVSLGSSLTTTEGLFLRWNGDPIEGALVTVVGFAGSSVTDSNGRFSIAGVNASSDELEVVARLASARILNGRSRPSRPVAGGITDMGIIRPNVLCDEPQGEDCVDSDEDGAPDEVEIAFGLEVSEPDTDGDGTEDGDELLLFCNPLIAENTTVQGQVTDRKGIPLEHASVQLLDSVEVFSSDVDGLFTIPNIPACGEIQLSAEAEVDGVSLHGLSERATALSSNGTTDIGVIVLRALSDPLYPDPKFRVGKQPVSLAIADLNGDSFPDIVTANSVSTDSASTDLSVLLGHGDGTYDDEQRILFSGVGDSPQAVAIGDLNNDEQPDLVVASRRLLRGGRVRVFLGNGDGTFESSQQASDIGSSSSSLALGDFNADGNLDVVVDNSSDVSLLLGSGDGTLQPDQRISVGDNPSFVVVADLDQDQREDLIVVNEGSDDVSVLLGNGDGTFQDQQRFSVGRNPVWAEVGDVDGDERLDLVTANSFGGEISVLLGDDAEIFELEQRIDAGSDPRSLALVDLTADENLDLVFSDARLDMLSVLIGDGNGGFEPGEVLNGADGSMVVASADVNLDGDADLITANTFSHDVTVLLGNGDGTLLEQDRFDAGIRPTTMATLDFDMDGVADFVVGHDAVSGGNLSLWLGDGNGLFQNRLSFLVDPNPASVSVADFDNNGQLDLVTANRFSNNVSILLSRSGDLEPQQTFDVGSIPLDLAVEDVDRDGNLDVVSANSGSGDISVLLGNGDGTLGEGMNLVIDGGPSALALGKLDEDEEWDVAVADDRLGRLIILMGQGDGTFEESLVVDFGEVLSHVVLADLDSDGREDVVLCHERSERVSVLLGNGDGTFQTEEYYEVTRFPSFVSIGDVNGDEALDLAIAHSVSDDVVIWLGKGDGTFIAQQRFFVGGEPSALELVDLNRDGTLDLLSVNHGTGDVSVLLHR